MARYRKFEPWMLNGNPGNISRACQRFIVRAVNAGLHVTSTTGGRHAPNSYHKARWLGRRWGKGRAVDVAGPWSLMVRFQRQEHDRGRRYRELYGPDNTANRRNSRAYRLAEGSGLETQHDTHVHAAPRW